MRPLRTIVALGTASLTLALVVTELVTVGDKQDAPTFSVISLHHRQTLRTLALRLPATGARTSVAVRVVIAASAALARSTTPRLTAADDLLQRTRASYSGMRAYVDTGVVLHEYGPSGSPNKDRHTFSTAFRRDPRGFFFDFTKQGGDRFVIWGDPNAFHTWWKATGVVENYPNPNNIGAFSLSGPQTSGSALMAPTLLYAKALQGIFTNFTDAVLEGSEVVGGHACQRFVGTTYDTYGATGRQVNNHQLTVWIDTESFLLRKIIEEWKPLPGQVNRTTTTFEPQANPALDDTRFRFTPPSSR
jgi:hypothetical protein